MSTIRILKNGPYQVSEDVKLYREKIETKDNGSVEPKKIGEIEIKKQAKDGFYYLCRCGQSKNAPFCDGTHFKEKFIGQESASRKNFKERAEVASEGGDLKLLDDHRCAFARFCHRCQSETWTLTQMADDFKKRSEALKGSMNCPSGRLVHVNQQDKEYEKEYEPQIAVVEDPERGVSAGLFVRGKVQLFGEDNFKYEKRNRYALCRCGQAENKPFCDATHIMTNYKEEKN